MTSPCYAKVNLTLDVLSRRPDGYHNLASVMVNISLADELTISQSESEGIRFSCLDSSVPVGDENLVVRAAHRFYEATDEKSLKLRRGLDIHLEKRIPMQAGLGGGSSDAAAALRMIHRLHNSPLSPGDLQQIASKLGSDVPFFLSGGAASVRGRGDVITPLVDTPPLWMVLVKPDIGVSTAEAYAALDAIPGRESQRATHKMEVAINQGSVEEIIMRTGNDFEQWAFERYRDLAILHDDFIMAGCINARLAGSGSAVFGMLGGAEQAEKVAGLMRKNYDRVFVARTVGRSEALQNE